MDAELILATLTDPQAERLTGGSSARQQAAGPPGTRNNVSFCCRLVTALPPAIDTACACLSKRHTELCVCHVGSSQCDTHWQECSQWLCPEAAR